VEFRRAPHDSLSEHHRTSALSGRVDYVDLAERVVQGVTVEVVGHEPQQRGHRATGSRGEVRHRATSTRMRTSE